MNIVICGATGRMGKELISLIDSSDGNFNFVGQIDKKGIVQKEDLDPNVVIDFSLPEALPAVVKYCDEYNLPLISGTTGLLSQDMERLNALSKKVAVLWAPNMSLGVHFLNHLITKFGKVKDSFDFQIEEFHHNKKIDKPSGTGKLLQQTLKDSIGKEPPEVLSIRGGGIFGIHKVWAMSNEEVIQLEHTALNRQVFAKGALTAAKWIHKKTPGMYNMTDVLGLKE